VALSRDLAAVGVHPDLVERCRLLEQDAAQAHCLLVSAHAGLTEHLRLVREHRSESGEKDGPIVRGETSLPGN